MNKHHTKLVIIFISALSLFSCGGEVIGNLNEVIENGLYEEFTYNATISGSFADSKYYSALLQIMQKNKMVEYRGHMYFGLFLFSKPGGDDFELPESWKDFIKDDVFKQNVFGYFQIGGRIDLKRHDLEDTMPEILYNESSDNHVPYWLYDHTHNFEIPPIIYPIRFKLIPGIFFTYPKNIIEHNPDRYIATGCDPICKYCSEDEDSYFCFIDDWDQNPEPKNYKEFNFNLYDKKYVKTNFDASSGIFNFTKEQSDFLFQPKIEPVQTETFVNDPDEANIKEQCNIVFISDGYLENEEVLFKESVKNMVQGLENSFCPFHKNNPAGELNLVNYLQVWMPSLDNYDSNRKKDKDYEKRSNHTMGSYVENNLWNFDFDKMREFLYTVHFSSQFPGLQDKVIFDLHTKSQQPNRKLYIDDLDTMFGHFLFVILVNNNDRDSIQSTFNFPKFLNKTSIEKYEYDPNKAKDPKAIEPSEYFSYSKYNSKGDFIEKSFIVAPIIIMNWSDDFVIGLAHELGHVIGQLWDPTNEEAVKVINMFSTHNTADIDEYLSNVLIDLIFHAPNVLSCSLTLPNYDEDWDNFITKAGKPLWDEVIFSGEHNVFAQPKKIGKPWSLFLQRDENINNCYYPYFNLYCSESIFFPSYFENHNVKPFDDPSIDKNIGVERSLLVPSKYGIMLYDYYVDWRIVKNAEENAGTKVVRNYDRVESFAILKNLHILCNKYVDDADILNKVNLFYAKLDDEGFGMGWFTTYVDESGNYLPIEPVNSAEEYACE